MNKRREEGLVLAGTGLFTLFLEIWKELHEFRVRRYRIRIPASAPEAEPVKLVFLSDLHGKCYGPGNAELIRAVERENPDLILVGGDMLTRGCPETDRTAAELLGRLGEIGPVYLANGNHEQMLRLRPEEYGCRYELYKRKVQRAGVHVLENGSAFCRRKGISFCISGLELPAECYAHFKPRRLRTADVRERIGKPETGAYRILLAHTPVYLPVYARWGADLVLSGHLHGGIIGIPGFGGLITPQARLFSRYFAGSYREKDTVGIVSRGLGTHTVNLRLCNPAELVAVTLEPRPAGAPSCADGKNQI